MISDTKIILTTKNTIKYKIRCNPLSNLRDIKTKIMENMDIIEKLYMNSLPYGISMYNEEISYLEDVILKL